MRVSGVRNSWLMFAKKAAFGLVQDFDKAAGLRLGQFCAKSRLHQLQERARLPACLQGGGACILSLTDAHPVDGIRQTEQKPSRQSV